jgi:hypothetical protein
MSMELGRDDADEGLLRALALAVSVIKCES